VIRAIAVILALGMGAAPAWTQDTAHDRARPTAAPAEADSVPEGQARARLVEAGLRDVRDLILGNDGIWRAIAVTPQGRVVRASLDRHGTITMDIEAGR